MGGGNWGGVSFDPSLGYVFVNTTNMGGIGHLVAGTAGAPMAYRNQRAYERFLDQDHYPCQKPPWGELAAVNTKTGDVAWKVPLGNFDELRAQGLENTGTPNVGGSIATAGGLVFIAATNDSRMRAFESSTGRELWTARLDATGNATPITYLGRNGKQYVAIAAGGPAHLRNVGDMSSNSADSIMVFALDADGPDQPARDVTSRAPADAGESAASDTASAVLPDVEGKALVMRICGKCHGVETFAQTRMSRQEWKLEVEGMVARGAEGTKDEIRRVEDYLAKNLGHAAARQ
jgi:cytochrome c5